MGKICLEDNMKQTQDSDMRQDHAWTVMKMKARVQGILGNTNNLRLLNIVMKEATGQTKVRISFQSETMLTKFPLEHIK